MKRKPRNQDAHTRTNWRHAVAAYTEPRVLQVLALGFSSGLPLLLTYSTLSAWLATGGVRRAAIGTFALVGTPYAFKFLWAPLMDRVPPPLPLGRRRGWGITIQILLIGAILCSGIVRSKAQPASDGRLGGACRISIGEPGYRDRCLARGEPDGRSAGSRSSHDSVRLPDRHAGFRGGRPVDRSLRRVVRGLCHHGCAARCGTTGVFAWSRNRRSRRKFHMLRDRDGMRFATRFRPP